MVAVDRHPIRLVVTDGFERSRLTVFFRLLLAIPHLFWLSAWSFGALVVAVVAWVVTLAKGRLPVPLHDFFVQYVRYTTHVYAYVYLAADPYPGFTGAPGYPVDVEIDPPAAQRRWRTALRGLLAFPALLLGSALAGVGPGSGSSSQIAGASAAAFLGWFACLAQGRMPQGFRNLVAYALRYLAQASGYLFFLTDRYPDADPAVDLPGAQPEHPVRLAVAEDLRRSRLTVFFRLLLAFPHLLWVTLWWLAALLAVVASWAATLVRGRSPAALHRFLAAYVRYSTHVSAFLYLVANPFPGFTGAAGSYPLDIEIDPPDRQLRWMVALRPVLAVPALVVSSALGSALGLVGLFGWFAALVTGRMPRGLARLGAFILRYSAQTSAYLCLLTDRYPHSGPEGGEEPALAALEPSLPVAA